jgi:tRNA nucleotidyltransferase (CCA-adding enzyme)
MPDYMFLLESRLLPEQRAAMLRVQELSAEMGFNVYLTGGTVRDLITGATLRDLDFTVEGNPARVARELEKGGAKILGEDDRLRYIEILFAGDCDGSLAAARDDYYVRPGTRPEYRWSTIMEDLRRRDFSLNAIAISLNSASRGLLLDPANGLSDIERGEIRALTIHSFTNQPARLLRALRYTVRMGFKLEPRTQEWFALAIERDLHHSINPRDAGEELRSVAREERPAPILKAWESHELMEAIPGKLAKRHPDYEAIARLCKVREDLLSAGLRPRLGNAMLAAILGRLKPRAQSALLAKTGFRAAEIDAALGLEEAALRAQKELISRRRDAPIEAYKFMEKLPLEQTAWLLAESSKSKALSRIRAYLQKWRPLRLGLPTVATELEKLGLAHGPKFDAVIEQCFAMQLTGKGKTPEERVKILRKLAGIKEPPKKKIEEKKKKAPKLADKPHAPAADRVALPASSAEGAIAVPGGTAAPARAVSKVGDKKPARAAKKARPAKKKSRRK